MLQPPRSLASSSLALLRIAGCAALGSLLLLAPSAKAAEYNAEAEWVAAETATAKPWSYGYSSPNGSGFTLYNSASEYESTPDRDGYHYLAADLGLAHNKTDQTITYNALVTHPADELMLFPGNNGSRAIVRFTVPSSGSYHFTGYFVRRDSQSTTTATVVRGGKSDSPLFTQEMDGITSPVEFDIWLDFVAGETMDFGLDWGKTHAYSYGGTGLKLLVSSTPKTTPLNKNLLVNPGAEQSTGGATPTTSFVPLPGWVTSGGLSPIQYAAGSAAASDLTTDSSTVIGGGANYFAGGKSFAGDAKQTIDLSDLASAIDAGGKQLILAGYFGGRGSDDDNMTLRVNLLNASGGLLKATFIGGVTAAERENTTKLLYRNQSFDIPAGTVKAEVTLNALGDGGPYDNAYADNLSVMIGTSGTGSGLGQTSLTINGSVLPGELPSGSKLLFDASQSSHVSGLVVKAQYTTTPNDAASWSELPDGNRGKLTELTSTPGHYETDTLAYPAGAEVYFRAVSSAPAAADSVSNVLGPYKLHGATLSVKLEKSTPSDDTGAVARLGEDISYKVRCTNVGDEKAKALEVAILVPKYTNAADNKQKQFAKADISGISPGGQLVKVSDLIGTATTWILPSGSQVSPLDAQGQPVMAIRWKKVGDLAPGYSQFVAFKVNVNKTVKVPSAIINDSLEGYSTATPKAPAVAADEITSHSANPGVAVGTSIRLTVTPDVTTVAPGGYIDYKVKLENLSGLTAPFTGAVFTVPRFTRFAGFLNKKYLVQTLDGPYGTRYSGVVRHPGRQDEVVMYFAAIKPHSSATVIVTVQAQWVDPSQVDGGKLTTLNYGGGFLTADGRTDILSIVKGQAVDSAYEFFQLASVSSNFTPGDSGNVQTTFSGSIAGGPDLALLKAVADDARTNADDPQTIDDPQGGLLHTVQAARMITQVLAVTNNGDHAADEVVVQERLPLGTVLVNLADKAQVLTNTSPAKELKQSVKLVTKSDSTDASDKFQVTLDADQRTLRVSGLHLEPRDTLAFTYTVQLKSSGSDVPTIGGLIHTGFTKVESGSTPHSASATPTDIAFKVTGQASYLTNVQALRSEPEASADRNTTAAQLAALFKKKGTDLPLIDGATSTAPKNLVPGFQRYTIDYQNTSGAKVDGTTLTVPIPTHTVFYRAGRVADGEVVALPSGGTTVETPAVLGTGTCKFHFGRLDNLKGGAVMIEVIVLPDALQSQGSFIELQGLAIGSGNAAPIAQSPLASPSHKATFSSVPLADKTHIPQVGLAVDQPVTVQPGQVFTVVIVAGNRGEVATSPIIDYTFPAGVQPLEARSAFGITSLTDHHPGEKISLPVSTNNQLAMQSDQGRLLPHTAGTLTIQMKVTGSDGTTLAGSQIALTASNMGVLSTKSFDTPVQAVNPLVAQGGGAPPHLIIVQNLNHPQVPGGPVILRLEGNQVVAMGPSSMISTQTGFLLASSDYNVAVSGSGDLVKMAKGPGAQLTSSAASIVNDPLALLKSGGNVFNGVPGLISQDGSGLISNDGNGVTANVSQLVAAGAGNLVAAGAGNLVAAGAGNLIAAGAGNLIAAGAGNLIAAGAGNLVAAGAGNILTVGGASISAKGSNLVAAGAGNLVAAGAGNLVAAGAGNIGVSLAGSSALVAAGAGNLVSSGGGKLVAAGAGN